MAITKAYSTCFVFLPFFCACASITHELDEEFASEGESGDVDVQTLGDDASKSLVGAASGGAASSASGGSSALGESDGESTASGGADASGGSTSTGGSSASGGAVGSGGDSASGGSVGSGGSLSGGGDCDEPSVELMGDAACGDTFIYQGALYVCLSQAVGENGEPTGCGTPGVYCSTTKPDHAGWGSSAWALSDSCD